MTSRSERCRAALLVACGLLLGPANGATPLNAHTSPIGSTIVMLPVGGADKPSPVTVTLPATGRHITPSRLVSKRDLDFRRAEEEWRPFRLTFLIYKPDVTHRAVPVAVVSSFRLGEKEEHIWIQRVPASRPSVHASDVDIATIEHLYSLALEQNPHAQFCLNGFGHTCTTPGSDYPHSRLLREISAARERATSRGRRASAIVPWQDVTMASEPRTASNDRVGVRITREGMPLEGATVFFNRAPHSGCSAKSSPEGIVACDLVDQHGDDESHEGQEHVPILATFPGDVRADRILLPTTLTWNPTP